MTRCIYGTKRAIGERTEGTKMANLKLDKEIAALVLTVLVAIILMIVDRLNLGLSVGGFFNAIIAAVGAIPFFLFRDGSP